MRKWDRSWENVLSTGKPNIASASSASSSSSPTTAASGRLAPLLLLARRLVLVPQIRKLFEHAQMLGHYPSHPRTLGLLDVVVQQDHQHAAVENIGRHVGVSDKRTVWMDGWMAGGAQKELVLVVLVWLVRLSCDAVCGISSDSSCRRREFGHSKQEGEGIGRRLWGGGGGGKKIM